MTEYSFPSKAQVYMELALLALGLLIGGIFLKRFLSK